jgi:hypothetical protein
MALSHRQIQDFVHAFNQGQIQLEITYRVTRLDAGPVKSRLKTDLAARVRPTDGPRLIIKDESPGRQMNDIETN